MIVQQVIGATLTGLASHGASCCSLQLDRLLETESVQTDACTRSKLHGQHQVTIDTVDAKLRATTQVHDLSTGRPPHNPRGL